MAFFISEQQMEAGNSPEVQNIQGRYDAVLVRTKCHEHKRGESVELLQEVYEIHGRGGPTVDGIPELHRTIGMD